MADSKELKLTKTVTARQHVPNSVSALTNHKQTSKPSDGKYLNLLECWPSNAGGLLTIALTDIALGWVKREVVTLLFTFSSRNRSQRVTTMTTISDVQNTIKKTDASKDASADKRENRN